MNINELTCLDLYKECGFTHNEEMFIKIPLLIITMSDSIHSKDINNVNQIKGE